MHILSLLIYIHIAELSSVDWCCVVVIMLDFIDRLGDCLR